MCITRFHMFSHVIPNTIPWNVPDPHTRLLNQSSLIWKGNISVWSSWLFKVKLRVRFSAQSWQRSWTVDVKLPDDWKWLQPRCPEQRRHERLFTSSKNNLFTSPSFALPVSVVLVSPGSGGWEAGGGQPSALILLRFPHGVVTTCFPQSLKAWSFLQLRFLTKEKHKK